MKKQLFLFCSLLLSLFVSAQNGGQAPENNLVKLEQVAVANNVTQVSIYSKQSCSVVHRVKLPNEEREVTTAPNSATIISIPSTAPFVVKVKPLTTCINNPDDGWVELTTTGIALPLKWKSFNVKRIKANVYLVEFEVYEVINIKYFLVQGNFDNSGWVDLGIVLPDGIQPDKKYSLTIDRNKRK